MDDKALLRLVYQSKAVPYRAEWNTFTGDPVATIFLQQTLYWYGVMGRPFYKYNAPTENRLEVSDVSWQEELGLKRSQFEAARNAVATRVNISEWQTMCTVRNAEGEIRSAEHLIYYWVTHDHKPYYAVNEPLLAHYLNDLYSEKAETVVATPGLKIASGGYKVKSDLPKTVDFTLLEERIRTWSGCKSFTPAQVELLNKTIKWYDPRIQKSVEQTINQLYADAAFVSWINEVCEPYFSKVQEKSSKNTAVSTVLATLMKLSEFSNYLNKTGTKLQSKTTKPTYWDDLK